MKVYESIRAVTLALSSHGIQKTGENKQQGYKFRGIDSVLNALSGPLCDANLTILPRVTERTVVERETKSGGALFNVTVKVEFDFVNTEDGSAHTVVTYGEAMDSADKATNKALSAAYKYMALLAFCVPTESSPDNDADFTTHQEVVSALGKKGANFKHPPAPPAAAPPLLDEATLKTMIGAVSGAASMKELRGHYAAAFGAATEAADDEALALLAAAKDARKMQLEAAAALA